MCRPAACRLPPAACRLPHHPALSATTPTPLLRPSLILALLAAAAPTLLAHNVSPSATFWNQAFVPDAAATNPGRAVVSNSCRGQIHP